MSEAVRCFNCLGVGYDILDEDGPNERREECYRCRGSGGLYLRAGGPGYPPMAPDDDIYEPVPKGVNW